MASNQNKMISVCMTTFNGSKYIEEQIFSILNQLPNVNDELIISDDGSSDNTVEIIKKIDDPRIELYVSSFKNVIKNFEFAIGKATGEVVFLSDQDDIWHKEKVVIYLNHLQKYDLVYSNVAIIDSKGEILNESLYDLGKNKSGLIKNLIKNSAIGATFAFNRRILNRVLPFPDNIEMHDTWTNMVADLFFTVKYIDTPMLFYRRHGNNVSSASEKSLNGLKEKFFIRIRYMKSLITLIFKNIL
jgi:glycosyltransferase involved in cell wall biosynthesis